MNARRRGTTVLLVVFATTLAWYVFSLERPRSDDTIGGQVVNTTKRSAEAGVWVIAETDALPTHFRKIVVTDENGRFLLPDLPLASYHVWVRGYGLTDSAPVNASLGDTLTLRVNDASSARVAAKVYPASYWFSLYEPPADADIPNAYTGRDHWVAQMKLGCMLCHQLGGEMTRLWAKPEHWDVIWQRAGNMGRTADRIGRDALRSSFASWNSRIAQGEVPEAPPRPSGLERHVVVTQWAWGDKEAYIHDEVATDKRNPALYPYGKVYGVDIGQDKLWALDPVTHSVSFYPVPTRNGFATPWNLEAFQSWNVYKNPANPHNPMLDDTGKVWITTQIRRELPEDRPSFTKQAITSEVQDDSSAERLAEDEGNHHRQLGYFDTKTERFVLIDTAYGTHHLQFDWQGRLWTTGDSVALGMFDPSKFDPDDPLNTEGAAQRAWVKVDSTTGKPVSGGGYGIIVSPVSGVVWRASPSAAGPANKIMSFDPKTRVFKDYPLPPPARGPRGIDASTDGNLWFGTGSGHLGRFDPVAERFTYWQSPGPKLRATGAETGSADFHYYIWVDQFDTLGMGKDMVILTGTNSDALLVFDPTTEKFTTIRVPYPLGMFHRGLDGRIDDPEAGWKGRGLWVNYGGDPIMFTERTGMGYLNHVQLRPHPLAR
jgi:streptogramin lyase